MGSDVIEIRRPYKPNAKQAIFHASPCKYKVLKGALGSSKTRMAVEEVNTLMAEHPGIVINVMRKTMPALRDSTLHEFLKYLDPQLGKYNGKTEQFNIITGGEVRFRGLDEYTKTKSTEPAVIVLDEAEEFTFEDFKTLKGRARQMTDHRGRPYKYPIYIIIIFNPVDEEHWLYQQFVGNAAEYQADGGLLLLELSTYDNLENLPVGYIDQVSVGLTPEEIDRLIWGKWGSIIRGKPVYAGVFNADLHLRKIKYEPGIHTLSRGWDFGFNHPAVSFILKDPLGRKNIHHEMMGTKEYLDVFALRILEETNRRYGQEIRTIDFCDPRGFDKSQNSTSKVENSVQILNDIGVYPTGERGIREYVEPGIRSVRRALCTLIDGVPELTISPDCAMIRAGFGGRYVRGDDGKPIKAGLYEHLMDAVRYPIYMDKESSAVKEAIAKRKALHSSRPASPYTGYRRG
jgi:PBSX family phage terminase large subunit